MKKNILSILILSLCFLNIILSALIVFTMVPTIIKTNKLIGKVASNIDFEIEGQKKEEDIKDISIEDIETYHVVDDIMVNLTIPSNTAEESNNSNTVKNNMALINVSLSVNKTSASYKSIGANLINYESIIKEAIINEISKLTLVNFKDSRDNVKAPIVEEINKQLQAEDLIISISFGKYIAQ